MGGMPSARGLEWRTDGESRKRYGENFDKIKMGGTHAVVSSEVAKKFVGINVKEKPGRKMYVWAGKHATR